MVGATLLSAAFRPQPSLAAVGQRLAVTPAGYDDFGAVLKNLGFKAEVIQEEQLKDTATLARFDTIFVNCSGSVDEVAKQAAGPLKDFVQKGGSLYLSDFTNAIVQEAFPGKITFYKAEGQTADLGYTAPRVGNAGTFEAKVTDAGIGALLDKLTISVNFDLGAWAVMTGVGSGVRVFIRGEAPILDYSDPQALSQLQNIAPPDFNNPQAVEEWTKQFSQLSSIKKLTDIPYAVAWSEGQGSVLYTSFHNEAQTTADVSRMLEWFAIRTRAAGLTSQNQGLASSSQALLLEVTDGINQGETKTYNFAASGEADFDAVLNFGGSQLGLTVKDPKGKVVKKESVSQPPVKVTITKPTSGIWVLEVKGEEVSEPNMPFALSLFGEPAAAADQSQAIALGAEKPKKTGLLALISKPAVAVGLAVAIVVVLVVVFMLVRRSMRRARAREP